jgi:chemotaxis protein histidine kinase CheA
MADSHVMSKLVVVFSSEAREWSQSITRHVLEAERAADPAALASSYELLARLLHNLKGTSATVGLDELSELAHVMEDVLVLFSKRRQALPGPVADALLTGLDHFMARLRATAEGKEDLPSLSESVTALERIRREEAEADALSTGNDATTSSKAERKEATAAHVMAVATSPNGDASTESGDRVKDEGLGDGTWRVQAKQVIALMREVEQLREIRLRLEQRKRQIGQGIAALARLELPALTREAVTIFSALEHGLSSDAEETAGVVQVLEDDLKEICTVPVRTIIEPLYRVVRDQCRTTGKEAALSVVGAEIALDRRIVEVLKRALVHLVRNAIDHGMDPPALRKQRGKHREGVVVIRTELHGNMAFVEVADDGSGLDTARIREVAAQTGIVSSNALGKMDDAQLHQLIFASGFSTSREVTQTSGRGVGLDIVRTELEELGGSVTVQSIAGQSTRFLLTMPVELGSSALVIVRFGEHQLAVPAPGVDVIVGSTSQTCRIDEEQMRFSHRGELIVLHDLGAVLGARQPQAPVEGQPILVVESQGRRTAVIVDEVLGDWDLVIRALPPEVRDVPAYQGVVTSATGEILMVLRVDWLVSRQASAGAVVGKRQALVVDDALTVRALHRAVLEAAGFVVHTTGSGREALERAQNARYDVVIADVQMPEMDGYEMTAELRSRDATKTLPIVLVSTHDSEEAQARGQAVGADAFVSKKDCEAGALIATVSRVMARRSATI